MLYNVLVIYLKNAIISLEEITMNNYKIPRYLQNAGAWFVASHCFEVYENYELLTTDKKFKERFFKKIFDSEQRDLTLKSKISQTSAILKIIRMNKIIKSLHFIVNSEYISTSDPITITNAYRTLSKFAFKYNINIPSKK
jgi:nitrogenase molybdenum-iron protein alpha/beta subunit